MQLRSKTKVQKTVIPTASMSDIAFLLIIFFMLTTSFSPERTSVQLPESIVRSDVSDQASIIAIKEDGTIMFTSGEEPAYELSGPNELAQVTKEIVNLVENKEFVIKADRNVPYQMVDSVLDALRTNGARNVGLLTRPEPKTARAVQ